MKFTYEIYDIGWANASIEINGNKDYFSVSYLTDGLRDLVEGIMSLIPKCMPEDEIRNKITFELYAEPGGSVWKIISENCDQIHVIIESYEDLDLKIGRSVSLDEVCNKTEFIKCVLDEMTNILKEYGIVGYRETWYEHDFPISAYLKLKSYLMTKEEYQIQHIERHPGNEYSKSELQEELMLLGCEDRDIS